MKTFHAKKTLQARLIADMLVGGHTVSKLTTLQMHIGNLGDVIMNMRRDGISINTISRKDGAGNHFTCYEMAA